MFDQMLQVLIGIIASFTVSVALALIWSVVRRWFDPSEPRGVPKAITYQDKVQDLTKRLTSASREVDLIVAEMTTTSQQREASILALESRLDSLADRETELQERIDTLQQVPLRAAELIAAEMRAGDRRSASRDWLLFGAGVVVSAVMPTILGWLGL